MANKQSFAGWPQGSSCFSVQRPTHAQACLHHPPQPRFSLGFSSSPEGERSAAPQTDHQRSETASVQKVRAPPRFAARWDSHHLEIPRDTSPYCLHSALCLQPACYLQPLYDFFAHNSPLTLLPPQEQHTPVRQRKATKQHPPPPHIRPRGDTTPQP